MITQGWRRYVLAVGLLSAATALSALIHLIISPTNLVVVYLLSVVLAARYLGRGPAILVSVISVAAFDFFFVPPYFTLAVSDTEYLLTFLGLLVVGLVISQLTAQVLEQAEAARRREAQTAALYEMGRDLTAAAGLESAASTVITHLSQTFNCAAVIFLPEAEALKVYAASPGLQIGETELALAAWVYQNGQAAGQGSEILPEARLRCQPLKTTRGVIGILGVQAADPAALSLEQRRTLDMFANQVALAIERARLAEQAQQAELLAATEKLQTALLNSISHDLRTPLVSVTGALSSLEEGLALDEAARQSLIVSARQEADRLNRLVGNLLDITRLEAGAMRVHRQECDLQELIGAALAQVRGPLEEHPVEVALPATLPPAALDFVLAARVLVNVIENAVKYSPPGAPVEIQVHCDPRWVEIAVLDRGLGIPPEDVDHIFEKFYRVQRPEQIRGTGLGLSISKGIVEAHGGVIYAANRTGGGAVMTMNSLSGRVRK